MIERRHTAAAVGFSTKPLSVRQSVTAAGRLQGLAAVFFDPRDPGTEFELMAGIFERIDPHCFDDFLRSSGDVVALWNHDMNHLLGRRSADTLSLSADTFGLRYSVVTPDTGLGHDLTHQVGGVGVA